MKLDFEKLFCKALSETIDNNGGSLYDALFEFGIDYNSEEGQAIKEWFGWEEEPEDYENEEECEEYEFDGVCPYCGGQNCDFVDSDEDSDKYICRDCNEDFLFYVTDGTKHTRNGRLIEREDKDNG